MPLLDFPSDMYHLRPNEPPMYGDSPALRRAVHWFISLLPKDEWPSRRDRVAKRFYLALVGEHSDPSGKGRYFDDGDAFGWYLFLAACRT
jgi:hypothetical protein